MRKDGSIAVGKAGIFTHQTNLFYFMGQKSLKLIDDALIALKAEMTVLFIINILIEKYEKICPKH
jgi:hypothetical protein